MVSTNDHIEFIFNGLSSDYDTSVISVNSRKDAYTIEEIKALLFTQESRIEKHTQAFNSASSLSFVNLTTQASSKKQFPGTQPCFTNPQYSAHGGGTFIWQHPSPFNTRVFPQHSRGCHTSYSSGRGGG